jgi:hypothetical protein
MRNLPGEAVQILSIISTIIALLLPSGILLPITQMDADCQELVNQLTGHPGWYEALINPVITSEADIAVRTELYRPVYECLVPSEAGGELDALRRMTEYFLIFVAGEGTSQGSSELNLIDLRTSDDPAVVRLRDRLGIPAPEGYVFVRIFPSRQDMPQLVRRAFEDENVAGVTYFTRYIAVLVEEKEARAEKILQAQALPLTVSHELVHAYVNAVLGEDDFTWLPRWYSEGMAIYFSGSGIEHRVVTPGFEIVLTSPAEYIGYRDNFRYLEAQHGRDRMETLITDSLEENNPALLYLDLGIQSEEELVSAREGWLKRQNALRVGFGTAVILLAAYGIFRVMPDLRCEYCDYTGKAHQFSKGYCPECGMPFDFDSISKKRDRKTLD